MIDFPQASQKKWIPSCPLFKQVSHFSCRGHFFLVLVDDSVNGWLTWAKRAFSYDLKVTCPARKSTFTALPDGTFFEPCSGLIKYWSNE